MNRRAFVTGLGAVLAAPLAAAQHVGKSRRLGVLIVGSPETTTSEVEAFRQGLRDFGYVDGQSLAIEYRYVYGRSERASTFVGEFIRMNVDVIVAAGGPMALTAKNLTQTIPIVFVAAGDPVHYGIVMSLARSGGNTTGLALPVDTDFIEKWMQLLKEAAPAIARIGFIEDLNMRLPKRQAIREVGVRRMDVGGLADIGSAFAKLSNEHGGVIASTAILLYLPTRHRRARSDAQIAGDIWVSGICRKRRAHVLWTKPSRLCLPLISPIDSRRPPKVFVMESTDARYFHHPSLAGGCTLRGSGASLPRDKCVRAAL
jgi:hypothetical protein